MGTLDSPASVRWLPAATDMVFPGHATIADAGGSVVAQMLDAEGVITAPVTLDHSRKQTARPKTFVRFVYPAGPVGALTLLPAWLFGHIYAHSHNRRRRARLASGKDLIDR